MIDAEGICVAFPVPDRQSLYMTGTEVTHPVKTDSKKVSRSMSASGCRTRIGATRIGVSRVTVRGGT